MSVSPSFRSYVLEQLAGVTGQVRDRAMFGGVGVYSDDLFFALMDDDVLYLKVDDTNRPDFEARGLEPFRPDGYGGQSMPYYPLPEDVLEDLEALKPWVVRAVDVARRKKTGSGRTER